MKDKAAEALARKVAFSLRFHAYEDLVRLRPGPQERRKFDQEIRKITRRALLPVSLGILLSTFVGINWVWFLLCIPVSLVLLRWASQPTALRAAVRGESEVDADGDSSFDEVAVGAAIQSLQGYQGSSSLGARFQRTKLNFWSRFVFYRPFSFQNIWWWTLILGLVSVATRAHIQAQDSSLAAPPLEELTVPVSLTLVAATIAYIATNLIGQLFNLGDDFRQIGDSLGEAVTASNEMASLNAKIKEAGREATQLLDTTVLAAGVARDWASILQNDRVPEELKRETRHLIEEMLRSSSAFYHQMEDLSFSGEVTPFVGRVLRTFLAGQTEILNTRERRLITRFSNLGRMSKELTRLAADSGRDMVAFGLLVLPPLKFFHYDRGRGGRTACLSDPSWWDFLEENRVTTSTESSVALHRYFLSVKPSAAYERKVEDAYEGQSVSFPPNAFMSGAYRAFSEIAAIISPTIVEQLDRLMLCDERGLPVGETSGSYLRWEEVGARLVESRERRDVIEVVFPTTAQEDEPVPTAEFAVEWKPVRDVLAGVFHRRDRAFVLEFDQDVNEDLGTLVDPETKKLKDYFAIGERREDEIHWELCLKSLYDKDFDVANVEIVHQACSNWDEVCNELAELFGISTPRGFRRVPVTRYGYEVIAA